MSLRFITQVENTVQKYFDYFIKEKTNQFKIFYQREIEIIFDEFHYDLDEQIEHNMKSMLGLYRLLALYFPLPFVSFLKYFLVLQNAFFKGEKSFFL